MAGTTGFFNPTDILNINTLLGLEGDLVWDIQSNNPSVSKDRASGLNQYGDEKAWKEHNSLTRRTLVYECTALTGFLMILKAGQVTSDGIHIDSCRVEYVNAGWPKLTVQCHQHTGATGTHAEGSCRTYTKTVKLPAQFGIPAALYDYTEPDAVVQFGLNNAAVAMRSLAYGLSATHVDELGGAGDWFAGENRDGTETLDVGFLGVPETAELTIGAQWGTPSDAEAKSNTASDGRTLQLVRHIAKD